MATARNNASNLIILQKALDKWDWQMFQLPNDIYRKILKLMLWSDILSDMISYDQWPHSYQKHMYVGHDNLRDVW